MNKKQQMNLDIVSRIDEEIVDKATKKRAALVLAARKRSDKRITVLLVAVITLVALLAATLVVLLVPNPDGPPDEQPTEPVIPIEKQVPIYQGMSVSDKIEVPKTDPVSATGIGGVTFLSSTYKSPYASAFELLGSQNGNNGNGNGNNGNHHGQGKSAEEIIDENITLTVPAQDMYTAQPNQDLYITVHISNPDSFEIMSFTLNGKKYSSYMFEEGSDMENLILKVNVGEAEGLVEYTIDAIKYIDGTEIKDVIMDGDRTVKVGVYSEKQPTPTISDEVIGINKMSFTVIVKDILGLLELTEGKLYAVLMNGETLIDQVELAVGEETKIVFENLKTATYYSYAIVACYDRLDGEGYGRYLLASKEFYTEGIMAFDSVEIGQESVSFGVIWNEDFENKKLVSLSLYHGDTLLRELDTNATEITGLFSNYEYTLIATYLNGDKAESTVLDFITQAKSVPTVEVSADAVDYTSISFSISVTDEDSVGEITAIELVRGGEVVAALTDLDAREFTGLLTCNDYTVRVTYTYDLNDNTGDYTVTGELEVKTLEKIAPTVEISADEVGYTSISFDIFVTDEDGVGEITAIDLIRGGEVVATLSDLNLREFTGLLTNNDYTVKVTYKYDLGDGKGGQTIEASFDASTTARVKPTQDSWDTTADINFIKGSYSFVDVDSTIISSVVEAYLGDVLVASSTDTEFCLDGLEPYTEYTLKLTYTYDLGDGFGVQSETSSYTVKTAPYISVTDCSIESSESLTYQYGDEFTLKITFDNPLGVTVTSIQLNGKKYSVVTSGRFVMLTLVADDTMGRGLTSIRIEEIRILDPADSNIEYNVATLFVDDKQIFIDYVSFDAEFVDGDLKRLPYATIGENDNDIYMLIKLTDFTGCVLESMKFIKNDSPSDYSAESFIVTDFVRVDEGVYYFKYPEHMTETFVVSATSFTYNNSLESITRDVGSTHRMVIFDLSETVYISTPEDLLALGSNTSTDSKRYELTCDIDMTGYSWTGGGTMYGEFNGNGYSIKNLSFQGELSGMSTRLGLFSYAEGYIGDLHIEGATYVASPNNVCNFGFIAAESGTLIVENCSVDSASYASFTAPSEFSGYSMHLRAGGIIGSGAGGLVTLKISNCINQGSIVADAVGGPSKVDPKLIGGILGGDVAGGNVIIENCINAGNIVAKNLYPESMYGGGSHMIAGISSVNQGKLTVVNCLSLGLIQSENGLNPSISNIYMWSIYSEQITVTNCYAKKQLSESDTTPLVTVEQLGTKEFYTETLGWSEDVWDFSNLDAHSGKYPTLKK